MNLSLDVLCVEKNMSVRDLAKKVKVSEVQMWRYIRRERVPSIPTAGTIANALGIDWQEVIEMCKPEKTDLMQKIDDIIRIGIVNAHEDQKTLTEVRDRLQKMTADMNMIRSCKVCKYSSRDLCDPDADEDSEAFRLWQLCSNSTKSGWKWRFDDDSE